MTTPSQDDGEFLPPHNDERRRLVIMLEQHRRAETRVRSRVRRDANIATGGAVAGGVAAMWNTAGPDDFAGNAAAALRVMYWILYLLLIGALALTARTICIVIRHRSLRDARAATSTAVSQLNAWTAATHYRVGDRCDSPPPHDGLRRTALTREDAVEPAKPHEARIRTRP